MRCDTFDNISGSNKEETNGTDVGLKTSNDQLLAINGTFLVNMDMERFGRITHPVMVVENILKFVK